MRDYFFQNVHKIINAALHFDQASELRLPELKGRCLAVKISGIPWKLYISCENDQVIFDFNSPPTVHASIKASALTYLNCMLNKSLSDDVDIEGDADIVGKYFDFFSQLDVDWEEVLSRFVPDVFAHGVGNLFRDTKFFIQRHVQISQAQIQEWLLEVLEATPYRYEIENYHRQVNELDETVTLMQHRLDSLHKNTKEIKD